MFGLDLFGLVGCADLRFGIDWV